jgi:type II secretory pathway pseudopilin PulG
MMSDEDLQRFYERVAHDDEFREARWNDYEGTIDSTDLAPHVKAMLKSVGRERLAAMARKATGAKAPHWSTLGKVVLGVGAAALAASLLLQSAGARSDVVLEHVARSYLQQISLAERQYKERYGTFGGIGDLRRFDDSRVLAEWLLDNDFPYEFTITVDDDAFTATARHKTRPETRKAFVVGPDGAVKELNADEQGGR